MSGLKSTNLSAALNAAKLSASLNSTIRLNDYILTLEEIEGGHRLTARKGDAVQSMDIMDGTDGVQPDWNQNDESQPDYVRNRTHWLERPYEPIVWDGSTEGRDSIDVSLIYGYPAGSLYIYKISDVLPSKEELSTMDVYVSDTFNSNIKGSITNIADVVPSAVWSGEYSADVYTAEDDTYTTVGNGTIVVCSIQGDFSGSLGVIIPSTGMYAIQTSDIHTININNDVWHTLDEKYLPDSYATKEYVDSLITGAIGGSY